MSRWFNHNSLPIGHTPLAQFTLSTAATMLAQSAARIPLMRGMPDIMDGQRRNYC